MGHAQCPARHERGRSPLPALELEAEVRTVAQSALTRHAARLALDGVDVSVFPWALPETGLHGYAPLGHLVEIRVNPDHPHFAAGWRTELPATLAHELHHARRWQGPGYGQTLLEVLVSEGLACLNGLDERRGRAPPYARADVDLEGPWARALPLLGRTDHRYDSWLFGLAAEGLPRWSGDTLGGELARHHLVRVGGSAADHVHPPAADFRRAWETVKGPPFFRPRSVLP
jgi:hypothetical protein